MRKLKHDLVLSDGRKMTPDDYAAYLKRIENAPVKHGLLMEYFEIIAQQVGEVSQIAEAKDANALLECAAMKALETDAAAMRDWCQSFIYTRTKAEASSISSKELPPWVR